MCFSLVIQLANALKARGIAARPSCPRRFLVNADPNLIAHKLCKAGNEEPLKQRRPFGDHWLTIEALRVDPELRESCRHLHFVINHRDGRCAASPMAHALPPKPKDLIIFSTPGEI
jgi:hypothetical protein